VPGRARRGRAALAAHTLVLDSEAVQALADQAHHKHKTLLTYVDAVATRNARRADTVRIITPVAARVEAGVARSSSALLGRYRAVDEPLDGARADRAVLLRQQAGGSVVDACVAEAATAISVGENVTVLTSDLTDIPRLVAGHPRVRVQHI
jgi:3',5'-cyclic AMP phosphodiesterase CpdA